MFLLANRARPDESYASLDADGVIWRKPFDIAFLKSSTLAAQSRDTLPDRFRDPNP